MSIGLLFTLKACWHGHELSELLTAADIAGLSDGRCSLLLWADAARERKSLRSKALVSTSLASASLIIATVLYCYFD